MALIIDPDFLSDNSIDDNTTEVFINTSNKTIKLTIVGDLSDDGVTLKAFYSFLKEQWRNDPFNKNLAAFPFPMVPITDESFEFVDGWDLANDTTRYLLRTGGWTVRNAAGSITQKWAGIIGLGTVESDDQLYYDQLSGSIDVQLLGQINQSVLILSDSNGDGDFDFDNRNYFKLFVREFAQTYDDASLTDIGVTQMDSIAYRFPISTSPDLKITNADITVSDSMPYDEINIKYFSSPFLKEVDLENTFRSFGTVIDVGTHSGVDGSVTNAGSTLTTAAGGISGSNFVGGTLIIHEGAAKGEYLLDGNVPQDGSSIDITTTFPATQTDISFTLYKSASLGASAEQIYEKIQYLLRQNTNVNAIPTGSIDVIGKTSDLLLNFVGDTLQAGTLNPVNPATEVADGVIIEGFSSSDTNRLVFRDATFVNRTYPFVAVLTLQFGQNLVSDPNAKYWVYFSALPGPNDDYGESSAILVQDNALAVMSGNVGGQASIQRTFNYDGNTQGGRTAGTDADIVAVSIGLNTGQYVRAVGTIARSISNTVSLVAPLERNYDNPS
jgi:hypothetical protein